MKGTFLSLAAVGFLLSLILCNQREKSKIMLTFILQLFCVTLCNNNNNLINLYSAIIYKNILMRFT